MAVYEHSYFAQQGIEDETSKKRIEADAAREHQDRLAAVRVIAGLAVDAAEARDLFGALGLTDAEVREARGARVTSLPTRAPARRPRKVTAA